MKNKKTALRKLGMFCVTYSRIIVCSQFHHSNDKNISDPNIMVDKFNVHFANVGKVLASRLNCTDNNAFLSYLKLPCPFSAYLYPTSPQEIIKLTNNLKLNIACGYNDISSFTLKAAIKVLALPLSITTNHCIALGTFPNQRKLTKVIPVNKSVPSVDIQNYRPISLFTSSSKIFEQLILNRLISFLEKNCLIIPTQFDFAIITLLFILFLTLYLNLIIIMMINVSLLSSFLISKKHLILSVTKYLLRNQDFMAYVELINYYIHICKTENNLYL